MAGDTDIYTLPVSLMPYKTRKLLSCLLNSTKIIPSDGPDKLPRDWRGFAHLANIPSDIAAGFHQCNDKTARVLDEWLRNGSATVGKLLEFMQAIDRYDVHDEILNDLQGYVQRGEIDINQPYQIAINNNRIAPPLDEEFSVITVDDSVGYEHQYHAFVLYADEDKDFVDELYEKLDGSFQICTKERLLPGHATEYAPVAQLISKRCLYIILVYSPHFLMSPANTFYRDYAQAVTIESKQQTFQRKFIPIMYKECQLPVHLMYYHKLYYKKEGRAMYDFWEKLRQSLGQNRVMPRLNGANSSHSGLNIVELPNSNGVSNSFTESQFFLPPVQKPRSVSMNGLDSLNGAGKLDDDRSSQISDISVEKKKKVGPIKKIINNMKWRKSKKEVLAGPSSAV
uniref:MyD88 n=1 Tax=Antheraea pernyi TaxID=7119 RepID=W5VGA1_ANTPE|nr:MyD88 [Antheraea pernyi]